MPIRYLTISLYSEYRKKSYSSKMKISNPIKNLAKDLNRRFSKEDIQMTNKHMKRCSAALVIKKTQIKTTVRYHFTPFRVDIIRKTNRNKCW